MSARAVVVPLLLAVAAAATAAVARIELRPGQWRLTSEVWIDGTPVHRPRPTYCATHAPE